MEPLEKAAWAARVEMPEREDLAWAAKAQADKAMALAYSAMVPCKSTTPWSKGTPPMVERAWAAAAMAAKEAMVARADLVAIVTQRQ